MSKKLATSDSLSGCPYSPALTDLMMISPRGENPPSPAIHVVNRRFASERVVRLLYSPQKGVLGTHTNCEEGAVPPVRAVGRIRGGSERRGKGHEVKKTYLQHLFRFLPSHHIPTAGCIEPPILKDLY